MRSSNGDHPSSFSSNGEGELEGNLSGMVGTAAIESANRPSASLNSSLSMTRLLRGLRRRWLLASTLGVLCGAVSAAATWYFLPPGKYTARALLQVDSVPQTLVFHDVQSQTTFQIYQKTQIALVKSRMVLKAALAKPEVAQLSLIRELDLRGGDEAIDWLERELQVDFPTSQEILRIALNGDKPEELKTLVNAVENAYLKEIVQRDKIGREKDLKDMTELSQRYEDTVKRKRKWLGEISKPVGTNDLVALARIREFNEQYCKRTETELLEVRADLRRLEADAYDLPANTTAPQVTVPDRTIDEYLRNDPDGREVLARKQRIEAQIREAQGALTGGDQNPIVLRYKRDLQSAEDELAAFRKNIHPRLLKEYQEKGLVDQQVNQTRLKQKMAMLQRYEDRLVKEVDVLRKKIEGIGKSSLDIAAEQADLTQAEETAKKVAHQVDVLTVERNAPERIRHLEDAYVSHPDEQKRRILAASAAGGGALALILFVISWWESRRQRVNSVDEVIDGMGIKLMGTVPALPSRRQLRMIGSNDSAGQLWQNILTESVDTARTMLLHMARSESLRSVMVTSAMGGEGKTSLSSHLAASLARSGRKTLLLDADLRNPAIHRLFGLDRSPGLCELLRGEAILAEAIQPTSAPGLCLIPAGRCDVLALQALAQDGFQQICKHLEAEFDFVVVDSAPVLPVADSLLVGQYVDAVIFSILHDVSRLPKVYAAQQRLEMLGIRMLGAVVSGTQVDSYGPDYQYVGHVENSIEEVS